MSWFPDAMQTSSNFPLDNLGMVVRPVGGGPGGSLNVNLVGGSFSASFSAAADPTQVAYSSSLPLSGTAVGFVDPDGLLRAGAVDRLGSFIITGSVYVLNPGSATISGTVGITGSVSVENVVQVTGSVYVLNPGSSTISGTVAVTQASSPWIVSGSDWVPTITGSVALSRPAVVTQGTSPWVVTGSVGLSDPITVANVVNVTGSVAVLNLPSSQSVTQGSTPWIISGSDWVPRITGSVSVENIVNVTGSVGLSGPVTVSNFPATQSVTQGTTPWIVSGSNWVPRITGSVSVENTVQVTGSVYVLNPGSATISGTIAVTGSVSLSEPAIVNQGSSPWIVSGSNWTPRVTGSVAVENIVQVTGSVYVLNPGSATISGTIQVTGSVSLSEPATVNQGTSPWIISGSNWVPTVTGSVVVGNVVSVTGSVYVLNPGSATISGTIAVTGSVSLSEPATVVQGTSPWIVSGSNWIPRVTGSITVENTVRVTGSVGLSEPVAVSNFPSTFGVTQSTSPWIVSGSNWIPTITGSVSLSSAVAISNFPATQNVVALSGSVTGLLVGGVSVASSNPVPVTGSVGITGPITGSVSLSAPVAVSNFPATQSVTQGTTPWIISGSNWIPTITGSVNLSAPVAVSNFPATFGVTQSTSPWIISGSAWTPTITGSVSLSAPIAVSNFPVNQNVTDLSGSVVGLLVGGVAVAGSNPVPITGSVGLSGPIAVSNFPATQSVTQGTSPWIVSGSNWIPTITGSVGLSAPVAISNFPATQNVSVLSGSVTGLLVGGVALASSNPLPVTGSVGITGPITGSVSLAGPVAVSNFPATQSVTQGTSPWIISGSAWTPTITGSVSLSAPVAVSNFPATQNVTVLSGSVTGLLLGGVAVAGSNPVPITGSVGLTGPITGSVGLSGPVAVSNFPATFGVTQSTTPWIISGSSWIPTVTGSVGLSGPVAVSNFPATQNVVALTGSITGLLVGGVAVADSNPVPVTGSVGLSGPVAVSNFPATQSVTQGTSPWIISGSAWTPTVTGSVSLSAPVAISNFPATQNVVTLTGSITGLLVGGVAVASSNPVPVTGSVGLSGPITGSVGLSGPVAVSNFPATQSVTQGTTPWIISGSAWTPTVTGSVGLSGPVAISNFPATQNVVALTGSITGLLVGGVAVAGSNPVPITGSVGITAPITGSVGLSGPVAVSNFPATQNVTVLSGSVTGLLVGGVALSNANPVPVTGSFSLTSAPTVNQGTSPWVVSGSNWIPTVTGSVVLASAPTVNQGTSPWVVQFNPATSASFTATPASATVVTILAANSSRKGAMIYNDSNSILSIYFGSGASSTTFTAKIVAGGYYEFPIPIYTGIVTGLWANANGNARATETV